MKPLYSLIISAFFISTSAYAWPAPREFVGKGTYLRTSHAQVEEISQCNEIYLVINVRGSNGRDIYFGCKDKISFLTLVKFQGDKIFSNDGKWREIGSVYRGDLGFSVEGNEYGGNNLLRIEMKKDNDCYQFRVLKENGPYIEQLYSGCLVSKTKLK